MYACCILALPKSQADDRSSPLSCGMRAPNTCWHGSNTAWVACFHGKTRPQYNRSGACCIQG